MLGGASLDVNQKLTRAFIDANPVDLVLTPRRRERTSSGGFKFDELRARDPQRMTLIETGGVGGIPRPIVTENGQDRVIEFTLLGAWDAKIQRYDVFTHDGKEWEVIELYHFNGYEQRAMVTRRG